MTLPGIELATFGLVTKCVIQLWVRVST